MNESAKARTSRRHPPEGAWRAYADGELSPVKRWRLRTHAAQCRRCRARLETTIGRGERISSLLGAFNPVTDLADSWARLGVLAARASRPGMSPLSAFLAGGMAAASVAASVLLVHPGPTRVLSDFHRLSAAEVSDECCSADPAEPTPLGVITVASRGSAPPLRVHYADLDGSGDFSPGDVVRSVTRVKTR